MTRRGQLIGLLADGSLHSGEVLAGQLGVTRAAVAKQVQALCAWGVPVEAVARRGYRLAAPLELLDAARLEAGLSPATRARLDRLELHEQLPSTNSHLLAETGLDAGQCRLCLAELQSAGRGRRGRTWLAPFGSGLCLSLAWLYDPPPSTPGALSLAAGVAVLRALARLGIADASLKWPNDIYRAGRKLGGILCELRFESAGPAYVVIGVGLNVRLPVGLSAMIEANGGALPADLSDLAAPPSRHALAVAMIDELVAAAATFGAQGFVPFAAEWRDADALRDRPVRVLGTGAEPRDGIARGIDAQGSLQVEFDGRLEALTAGEVSLRGVA
jgi:BirA family biotin operon repressor/biotin-[acetyl-CoA-carboxylase] ligase